MKSGTARTFFWWKSPQKDGLRYLARNRQARYAHTSGNLPRPAESRGHPDPHRLTAECKVLDAKTLNEILAWLGPAERVHVAGDPRLLERIAKLPDNQFDGTDYQALTMNKVQRLERLPYKRYFNVEQSECEISSY